MLSGSCSHVINGNLETLRSGDVCILPPPARHMQFEDTGSVTAKLLLPPAYFTNVAPSLLQHADELGSFLRNSIFSQSYEEYLLFHTDQDPEVREHVLAIGQEALRDDDYSDRIASGLFMSFLVSLGRDYPFDVRSVPVRNIRYEIMTLLRREYASITLETLAEQLYYSVPYCSKYIKKLFGHNFSYMLQWVRFQKAEEFLRNTPLTVSQISKELGYENPENFFRAFKNHYNLTPTQYRNQFAGVSAESPLPR